MADPFRKGDEVEWNTPQGKTHGHVERKLTEPVDIEGHHVAASEENPEYLVRCAKSGKLAAHKPDALHRRGG